MADTWKITDGSFKAVKFHAAIPPKNEKRGIISQEIINERRLQIAESPLVDGASVEDFGRKGRILSAEVIFFGNDYQAELTAFEALLNEGTTGVLILPDLDEAVYAKYQKHSRRTTNDSSTLLSVTWLEDKTKVVQSSGASTAASAQAALQSGNPVEAIPSIQERAAQVTSKSATVLAALQNNVFLKSLVAAQNAVTNARVTINSVLSVARNTREAIINAKTAAESDIAGLQTAINGLLNYTDILSLGLSQPSPLRYNTGVGAIDFAKVDDPTTTIVSGVEEVVTNPTVAEDIQSFEVAVKSLQDYSDSIEEQQEILESNTGGNTPEVTAATTQLVNAIKDLILIIDENPSTQVLTTLNTTLLEVCFANDIDVAEIDRIHRLNTHVEDILDIPAGTVLYI